MTPSLPPSSAPASNHAENRKGVREWDALYERILTLINGNSGSDAMSKLVGMTLISQRPQIVNKSVLSPREICYRLLYKFDRNAVPEWIFARETGSQWTGCMQSLARLPHGRAWLCFPSWLDIFEQVKTRGRDKYDFSAVPQTQKLGGDFYAA